MPASDFKTTRFMREHATAVRIQMEAQKRGTKLTLEEAHSVWDEYSERMCAGWISFTEGYPVADIWREITIWKNRRNRQ